MTEIDGTGARRHSRTTGFVLRCAGIGLLAGLMSGLFGVGGGTVIVPMLVLLLAYDQRLASGTSLAAVVPAALVGVISYAANGQVAWIPALILAAGAVVGAQIGTWMLPRIPLTWLRWAFIVFLVGVMVNLFIVIPSRTATLDLTWIAALALILAGVATGVLSGLLGVGGGIIIVPVLMLFFGMSDLIAKGTSLLMVIPTSVSGTIGNLRRRNTDLFVAAVIGVAACITVPLGAWIARQVDPRVGNILFAAFIALIVAQLVVRLVRQRRTA
ncbi:sulfite exporter TauE/SafE family protein [Microbacterium capsulatum]|uniref:Probable membrane transporter protein n=1 Tax=Microbacterium capsulatum TaxID=3041921 RepID=A0ABU0XFA9_9MICO|nr:sulfite exporter TauE/SafE family protein [Microbacterium sp. ASV81]MDQ4213607.1 sulfite exporter TauE/SafE family protein [Microbacterium sp. ASV81]